MTRVPLALTTVMLPLASACRVTSTEVKSDVVVAALFVVVMVRCTLPECDLVRDHGCAQLTG